MILRELVTKLGFQFDENGYKQAEKAFDDLRSKGDTIANVGKKLSLFVTAPILALAAAATLAANEQSDNLEVLRDTFSSIGDEAELTSRRISSSFGLSIASGAKLLASTGSILKNFSLTENQVLDTSYGIVELGTNLAAFRKVDTAETIAAITEAIAGRTMGLKKLGIVIDQTEIKDRVALLRSKGRIFSTDSQADALATLSLVQDRAAFSAGAYQRRMGGLDETKARLTGKVANLGEKFGKFLLPVMEKVALIFERFIDRLSKMDDRTAMLILIFGLLVASLGPLLLIAGKTIVALGAMGDALIFLRAVTWSALVPMALMALKFLAIAATVAIVLIAIEDLYQFFTGGASVFGDFLGWINDILAALGRLSMEFSKWIGGKAAIAAQFLSGTASPSQMSSGGATTSNSVNNAPNVAVNVNAAGMNPSDAANAVSSGVQSGLSNVFRQTGQNFVPGGAY